MNFPIVDPGPAGTNIICIEDEHEAMRDQGRHDQGVGRRLRERLTLSSPHSRHLINQLLGSFCIFGSLELLYVTHRTSLCLEYRFAIPTRSHSGRCSGVRQSCTHRRKISVPRHTLPDDTGRIPTGMAHRRSSWSGSENSSLESGLELDPKDEARCTSGGGVERRRVRSMTSGGWDTDAVG